MSDSLEQDIDKLVVDSRAVKEAAETLILKTLIL